MQNINNTYVTGTNTQNRYLIGDIISKGSFSLVFHCHLQAPPAEEAHRQLVIKITNHAFNERELAICKELSQHEISGVPQVFDWGETIDAETARTLEVSAESCFIVQELMGPSLLEIKESMLN